MGWPQPGRTPQTSDKFPDVRLQYRKTPQSPRNANRRRVRRNARRWDAMGALCRRRRSSQRTVHAFQPATGLWRTSAETSFCLCNCMIDANRAAIAVRMHWGIENKFHYTRDVTLREDASRIRKNPGVFARVRSPTIFSGSINPTPSRKTATPPLSAVSNPYFL